MAISEQGIPLMFVGMSVVFSALVLLMLLMKFLKRGLNWLHRWRTARRETPGVSAKELDLPNPDDVHGVLIAAIAITMILEDEEIHDNESMVLTLRSLPKPYSNWWMQNIKNFGMPKSGSGFRPTKSKVENTL